MLKSCSDTVLSPGEYLLLGWVGWRLALSGLPRPGLVPHSLAVPGPQDGRLGDLYDRAETDQDDWAGGDDVEDILDHDNIEKLQDETSFDDLHHVFDLCG